MLLDGLLGLEPDQAVDELSGFENQQGRDALNVEAAGSLLVLVNVQLGDDVSPVGFPGQFFECGSDHPAGRAPFRPEVDQNGFGLGDHLLKIGIRDDYRLPVRRRLRSFSGSRQFRPALPADRLALAGLLLVYAIF